MDESAHQSASSVLPLNSRRIPGIIVKRIAESLELPTSASLDECRQMIDGKLAESGREPMNIQVNLLHGPAGTRIQLEDATGVFTDLSPLEPVDNNNFPRLEEDRCARFLCQR